MNDIGWFKAACWCWVLAVLLYLAKPWIVGLELPFLR